MCKDLQEMISALGAQMQTTGALEISIADVDAANVSNVVLRNALMEFKKSIVAIAEIEAELVNKVDAIAIRVEAIAEKVKVLEVERSPDPGQDKPPATQPQDSPG